MRQAAINLTKPDAIQSPPWERQIQQERIIRNFKSNYGLKGPGSITGIASTPAMGPIQPSIQWIPETLSPGLKPQGREADHSPPSSADESYTSTLPHVFMEQCLTN
jgi:hypothetical protein